MEYIKLSMVILAITYGMQVCAAAPSASAAAAQQAEKRNHRELMFGWQVHFFVHKNAMQRFTGEIPPKTKHVDRFWRSAGVVIPASYSFAQAIAVFKDIAIQHSGYNRPVEDYWVYLPHPRFDEPSKKDDKLKKDDELNKKIQWVYPQWAIPVTKLEELQRDLKDVNGKQVFVRNVSICTRDEMAEKEVEYNVFRRKIIPDKPKKNQGALKKEFLLR